MIISLPVKTKFTSCLYGFFIRLYYVCTFVCLKKSFTAFGDAQVYGGLAGFVVSKVLIGCLIFKCVGFC